MHKWSRTYGRQEGVRAVEAQLKSLLSSVLEGSGWTAILPPWKAHPVTIKQRLGGHQSPTWRSGEEISCPCLDSNHGWSCLQPYSSQYAAHNFDDRTLCCTHDIIHARRTTPAWEHTIRSCSRIYVLFECSVVFKWNRTQNGLTDLLHNSQPIYATPFII
jgi:hypothetical protein